MKILRIRSHNMRDALSEARLRLGADVTVLHTKQYESPALFGLVRKQGVEILAGAAESSQTVPSRDGIGSNDLGSVALELSDIKRMLSQMEGARSSVIEPPISPAAERLIRNGVSRGLAESLGSELDSIKDNNLILDNLKQRIPCSGPIKCSGGQARVALIGPTGVGKTTTAAKLAAQYSLGLGKSVALLTLDTYRIGAVEQLSTYAKILRLPIEVAISVEDVDALIRSHQDKDLIIIDTVGRSQRNASQLAELNRFLSAARPTETHLVVSASSAPAVQQEVLTSFGRLLADRLVLSKVDECPKAGCILDLSAASLLPYSYVTCGQEVPDDISTADSRRLASYVWEGVR